MEFNIWQNKAQAFEKLHIFYILLLFSLLIPLTGNILLEIERNRQDNLNTKFRGNWEKAVNKLNT